VLGLNDQVFGNSVLRWIIALGVAAGLTALGRLVQRWLVVHLAGRAARTGSAAAATLGNLLSHTGFLFLLAVTLTLGGQFLDLPPRLERGLDRLFPVALILQSAAWGHWGIGLWIDRQFQGEGHKDGTSASRAAILGFILRLGLWSLLLLTVLDVLGFNITTLLASLGIGGIAVALALQNILGDLFASLSITLDKPFMVGDFITVDQCQGTVLFIGLKTTRIRSLSGEQIIIGNGDLLKSRIRNFQDLAERRVVFALSLSYRTPAAQLARLPETLRGIIEAQPQVRFDRAHCTELGPAGVLFEGVYYFTDGDFNRYMDTRQAINLAILAAFEREGVGLSFPALPGELVPGRPTTR